jgi:hypothetical protein
VAFATTRVLGMGFCSTRLCQSYRLRSSHRRMARLRYVMSLADLNLKIAKGGFLTDKMRKHSKKVVQDARANAVTPKDAGLGKSVIAPGALANILTDQQKQKILQRGIEGLDAVRERWNMKTGKWEFVPDMGARHKYFESLMKHWFGMPPQFIAQIGGSFEELSDYLSRIKQSPAMMDGLHKMGAGHLLDSSQNTAQSAEKNISAPPSQE